MENLLTATWATVALESDQGQDFGAGLLHLPAGVVVTGPKSGGMASAGGASWWVPPAAGDVAPTYGWRKAQDLRPIVSPPASGVAGSFGSTVAGDSTWLFIGAPSATVAGVATAGAVHAYRVDDAGVWQPYAVLENPQPTVDAMYGAAIDFDGTTLLVGVPGRLPWGGADRYVVSNAALGPAMPLPSPLPGVDAIQVGRRVAVHGDTLVLGSRAVGCGTICHWEVLIVTTESPESAAVSVETILTSPVDSQFDEFGDAIDFDGVRLAVAAPGERVDGVERLGAVRVYERADGEWVVTSEYFGTSTLVELRSVAIDGDLLAIGARRKLSAAVGQPDLGEATLHRLQTGGAVLLARASASEPSGDSGVGHRFVGRNVGLGHGYWTVAEAAGSFPPAFQLAVRVLPVAAASTDCDGDGVSDLQAVLNGAADCDLDGVPDDCGNAPDCEGDGVLDACAVAWKPSIPPPTFGSAWWGFPQSSPTKIIGLAWLVPDEVPIGSDGVLRGIEADWVSPSGRPKPAFVAVYDDPNEDGDPSDAVLRGAWLAAPSTVPGPDRVILESASVVDIGPPGTRYFVGIGVLALPGSFGSTHARAVPFSGATPKAWQIAGEGYDYSKLNLAQPSANATFELFEYADNMAAVGLFRSPADLDGDGIPDLCQNPADLDGNGVVDGADLSLLIGAWGSDGPGDLNGDGVVNGADLGVLLGAWG